MRKSEEVVRSLHVMGLIAKGDIVAWPLLRSVSVIKKEKQECLTP